MRILILTLFAAVFITACGFKGNLYLPDPSAAAKKAQKRNAQSTSQAQASAPTGKEMTTETGSDTDIKPIEGE